MYYSCRRKLLWLLVLGVSLQAGASWRPGAFPDPTPPVPYIDESSGFPGDGSFPSSSRSGGAISSGNSRQGGSISPVNSRQGGTDNTGDSSSTSRGRDQIEERFVPAADLKRGVCCTHAPYNTTTVQRYVKLVAESFVDSKTELHKEWCPGFHGTGLLRVKWCETYRRVTFMNTRRVPKTAYRKLITETKCDVDATVCCYGRVDVDGQCLTRKEAAKIRRAREREQEVLGGSLSSLFGDDDDDD